MKSVHKENSKDWWNEKYEQAKAPFLYSKEPSRFLVEHLDLLPPKAKVVEIACGEGRNSIALAAKGFDVTAIDFSDKALEKARKLAAESKVEVNFKAMDLDFYLPELLTFDAIISIDFRPALTLLKNLSRGLKQKGFLFMEANTNLACKEDPSLEVFECFKPNELLYQFIPSQQASFQILQYSELVGTKVFLVAKKVQLF